MSDYEAHGGEVAAILSALDFEVEVLCMARYDDGSECEEVAVWRGVCTICSYSRDGKNSESVYACLHHFSMMAGSDATSYCQRTGQSSPTVEMFVWEPVRKNAH